MKKICCALMLAFSAGLTCLGDRAVADSLELAPTRAAATAEGDTDTTRVILYFDLSAFPEGNGRLDVVSAIVEWPLAGMVVDRVSRYSLHMATEEWESGEQPRFAREVVEEWEVTPMDHEAGEGGRVRFRVTPLVAAWLSGRTANHGVVIRTSDLERQALSTQLSDVRLRILYGFVR